MPDKPDKNEKPNVSVVVPVYNSHDSLDELVSRISAALVPAADAHEIILVNDSSPDSSWEAIERLARDNAHVVGMNLMRNYGQHNALLAGVRRARHDIIITLDDDLQNPPEEIPRLLDKLIAEDLDVVYGAPRQEEHGVGRDIASQLTKYLLQNVMGVETARKVSAFRAFRTRAREAFADFSGPNVSIDVLLTWGASRFAALPVDHRPRQIGRSNYTIRKLVRHALNMTTGFSAFPLRLASWMGFAFTLFGLAILTYVFYVYFTNNDGVPGFPFLASIISIFSGAQLFSLGVIGEYIGRMHQRSLNRPSYIVRETTRSDSEK